MKEAMGSLQNTELQPPYVPPTAAPRAGVAAKPLSPNGQGRGRRAGAVSFASPTHEVWEAIVDAFRHHPGHAINAAQRAGHGVTPAYAKYAWENGWWSVTGCEYMIPVRDVITAEIATARAIAVRQPDTSPATIEAAKAAARDTVSAAVIDIGEIRASEAKTLKIAQVVAQTALATTGAVKKVMPALAARIAEAIVAEKGKLGAKELLRLYRQWAEIEHLVVMQAETVAKMRKHLLGEADITVAVEHMSGSEFASDEAALAEIRESVRLMERYRANNIVDLPATAAASSGPLNLDDGDDDTDTDTDTDSFDFVDNELEEHPSAGRDPT